MKTRQAYLEHANLTVSNLDETVAFLQTALPGFRVRGGGQSNGRKWLHIGTDATYLALNESAGGKKQAGERYTHNGLNHLGFVVGDVKAVAERLLAKGYKRSYPTTRQQYRIRDYFLDHAGNEYEFVQYLSDKPQERNDYSE